MLPPLFLGSSRNFGTAATAVHPGGGCDPVSPPRMGRAGAGHCRAPGTLLKGPAKGRERPPPNLPHEWGRSPGTRHRKAANATQKRISYDVRLMRSGSVGAGRLLPPSGGGREGGGLVFATAVPAPPTPHVSDINPTPALPYPGEGVRAAPSARTGHQAGTCEWIIRFSYQTILFARPRFSAMSLFLWASRVSRNPPRPSTRAEGATRSPPPEWEGQGRGTVAHRAPCGSSWPTTTHNGGQGAPLVRPGRSGRTPRRGPGSRG
jgi:hypothetical protein